MRKLLSYVVPRVKRVAPLKERTQISFLDKEEVAPLSYIFRFRFESETASLAYKIGQYSLLHYKDTNGEELTRPYIPISRPSDQGTVDFLIKYKTSQSQLNSQLDVRSAKFRKEGEKFEIEIKDSFFEYQGQGNFILRQQGGEIKRNIRRLGMVCYDTGITPFFQMTQQIGLSGDNNVGLSLIQESRTTEELFFEEDFVEIESKGKLFYYPVVEQPPDTWSFGKSPISESHLSHFMPHPEDTEALVMICGPRSFREGILSHLERLSYKRENILTL